MQTQLSSTAVIYAILSINSEIALQREFLDSPDILPDERENEAGILDDLEQTLMEFIELYKDYLKKEKDLPTIDELLHSEL